MSTILVAVLSIGMPLAALGLYDLQESLERWEHERHAQD
ncbi:MAG: hypothetical protein JWR32_1849 [Mycobacterium sp.]|jgi:hypothetical protein|nr:hypothetical protein [Mycobacterium sp.]